MNVRSPSHEELGDRLRQIRMECYAGAGDGLLALADAVGVPTRTWLNYEAGVAMPGVILLRFLDVTGVSVAWLLRGEGDRYTSK